MDPPDSAVSLKAPFSPSTLARSSQFQTWQDGANILCMGKPPVSMRLEFEKLSVFKLPSTALLQPPYGYNGLDNFYSPLKDWATKNPDFMQPNDIHSISYLSLPLGMSFQRIVIAVKDNAVESVQRRGVDDLVEMAFFGRPGCTHIINIEHSVRLRTSRSTAAVTPNANADALVVTTFPPEQTRNIIDLIALEMPDVPVRNIWKHAFWTDKTPSEVTLFRFVGEFKHTVSARNLNQLLMDFASGQCQLRALGIRSIIWGATCSSGVVEVYSSEWNINLSNVVVYRHVQWNLTNPVEFLKFYSFLCNLDIPGGSV